MASAPLVTPRTVVLDSEGLSSFARQDKPVGRIVQAALDQFARVIVPTPTVILAEVMRGKPGDAAV